jgi:RHS repeat-associated protein
VNGLLTASTLDSITDQWSYNAFGEPVSYAASSGGSPLFSEQLTRNDAGQITQKSESVSGTTRTYIYGYDGVGRLTSVAPGSGDPATYGYDDNGNRTSRTAGLSSETGSYDDQDRLLAYADTTFTYTANGELATKTDASGTTTYNVDEMGNLLSVTLLGGTQIGYLVDGQNRRIAKTVSGTITRQWIWSGPLRVTAELDGTGTPISRFVYATHTNVPDYMIRGGLTYRLITDHLGSVRLVVDASTGVIAERLDYDEFGRVLGDSNPGFQPFGFAGGLYDSDTGLVRFGARDYDPQTGRWTSKDPIGFTGGSANVYAYAATDPINFLDPNGLEHVQEPGLTKPLSQAGPIPSALQPDFVSVNVNIALPFTHGYGGWSGLFSVDRYGQWYWSVKGGGFGKPTATPVSGSCTVNWADQLSQPTPEQLRNLLSGHGYNVSGGYWIGFSQSYTPGSGGTTGVGIVTPQLGGTYNFSTQGRGSTGATW